MARKKTTVIHRKLGKHQADGLAYKEDKEIHIDERLKSKEYMLTVIHELLHVHQPKLTEKQVVTISQKLCDDMWSLKFRRIDE